MTMTIDPDNDQFSQAAGLHLLRMVVMVMVTSH